MARGQSDQAVSGVFSASRRLSASLRSLNVRSRNAAPPHRLQGGAVHHASDCTHCDRRSWLLPLVAILPAGLDGSRASHSVKARFGRTPSLQGCARSPESGGKRAFPGEACRPGIRVQSGSSGGRPRIHLPSVAKLLRALRRPTQSAARLCRRHRQGRVACRGPARPALPTRRWSISPRTRVRSWRSSSRARRSNSGFAVRLDRIK